MKVFISHDMKHRAAFDNVADALKSSGIEHWDPGDSSSSLRLDDRIRAAISDCQVCILVATSSSAKSYWCTAETAAFWGVGSPVLVYGADQAFDRTLLPPHLAGHYVEYRLSKLVESVGMQTSHPREAHSKEPPSIAEIIAVLADKLVLASAGLERARKALKEFDRSNPGETHVGMEGFEMAYRDHVLSLEAAMAKLQATQSTLWSLR
jgi:hypothetical protein